MFTQGGRKHHIVDCADSTSGLKRLRTEAATSYLGNGWNSSLDHTPDAEFSGVSFSQPIPTVEAQLPTALQNFDIESNDCYTENFDSDYFQYSDSSLLPGTTLSAQCSSGLTEHEKFIDSTLVAHLNSDSNNGFDEELCWNDDEPLIQDACFGAVVINSRLNPESIESCKPASVTLRVFGDFTRLTYEGSGKCAGFIRTPLIGQLLADDNVQLTAAVMGPTQLPLKGSRKQVANISRDCVVRIVVCGAKQDRFRVGALLSESNLYLQHPSEEECGGFEYCNPHFLVRPGASIPMGKNFVDSETQLASTPGLLNEINKSRIMRIFDLTNNESSEVSHSETLLSSRLKSALKDHQFSALAMMAEREWGTIEPCRFPSLWEIKDSHQPSKRYRNVVTGVCAASPSLLRGGLLADDMGLGKTFTALALICLSLDSKVSNETPHATLVITPKSTLPGWQSQIEKHIHCDRLRVGLYHGLNRSSLAEDLNRKDVILTTYETLRADSAETGPLFQNDWHRVILDEAHHIRNRSSQVFQAACAIKARHRWCLTGTPIHNSLDDYGALVSFIGVPTLAEKANFDYWITKPIRDKKPEGFTRLQNLVRATCLRRTKQGIGSAFNLPVRTERIEYVKLHQADQELYEFFKTRTANLAAGVVPSDTDTVRFNGRNGSNILTFLTLLRLICNHGKDLLPESALKTWAARDHAIMDGDGVSTGTDTSEKAGCSAKIDALVKNLQSANGLIHSSFQDMTDKSVIFSYWTKMLDLIQQPLANIGFRFCRIDGSTTLEERRNALNRFNEDPECTVMLASIGSGGEGLDLTVANHIHLMEPHWSPMAEAQAVDRVYRIGQVREVSVTRYIVPNSIETYILWIQQQKMKLVQQFVDTEKITQSQIDIERWKQLRQNLGV